MNRMLEHGGGPRGALVVAAAAHHDSISIDGHTAHHDSISIDGHTKLGLDVNRRRRPGCCHRGHRGERRRRVDA
jgi:hypothetical protein